MTQIERMTIALPTEMAAMIRIVVASGEYASSSEVFRDALRDWKYKRNVQEQELKNLIKGIQQGLADLKTGNTSPAENILARLAKKYQDML